MKSIILSTILLASTVTWADEVSPISEIDLFGGIPIAIGDTTTYELWVDFMAFRFFFPNDGDIENASDEAIEAARVAVRAMIVQMGNYADTYLVYLVAEKSDNDSENVAGLFSRNMTRGWGHIAKLVGIKPGSEEFMILKARGDLAIAPGSNRNNKGNNGRRGDDKENNGKGKGKN